jgi:hypothetical protein
MKVRIGERKTRLHPAYIEAPSTLPEKLLGVLKEPFIEHLLLERERLILGNDLLERHA